jgi:hemolysin (HlyC) family protein
VQAKVMNDDSERSSEGDSGESQSDPADPSSISIFRRLFRKQDEDAQRESSDNHADIAAASRGAREMLLNVRNMGNTRIDDVSVPRADIVALGDTATLDETVDAFRTSTFSRLPIYSETLDNPLGFIHLKDLALRYGFSAQSGDAFDIKTLLRPLLYVPPSMSMGVLLQKMQSARIHMALVIDEYGGVDGLVTIEDLVEEIVGEIADEHDTDEGELWTEEAPGVYLCNSRAPLQEFEEMAGVDLLSDSLDEEVDTLGGLVFMLTGRVPLRGEIIKDAHGNEFEILDADPRMVKRLRVRIAAVQQLDQAAE